MIGLGLSLPSVALHPASSTGTPAYSGSTIDLNFAAGAYWLGTTPKTLAQLVTGARTPSSFGLPIEDGATNLLLRSQEFDHAATWTTWNGATPVVTANTTLAPDGTLTADTILFNTTNYEWRMQAVAVANDSVTYAASVLYKAGTAASWQLQLNLTGGSSTVASTTIVNADGTVSFTTHGGTSTAVGSGWYLITAFAPNNSSGNTTAEVGIQQHDAVTGTVIVWGAQLEVNTRASSYIATTTSSASRAADDVTVPLTGSWLGASTGTIYVEGSIDYTPSSFPRLFEFSDGTDDNRLGIRFEQNSAVRGYATISGVDSELDETYSTTVKACIAWEPGLVVFVANGGTIHSAAVTRPSVTGLQLGNRNTTKNRPLNGTLTRFFCLPTRLSGAAMQALTS